MSLHVSSSLNTFKTPIFNNINSVILPEKDRSYDYLSKFFKCCSADHPKIAEKLTVDRMIKQEKLFHDMIINPSDHTEQSVTASWISYINWIRKIFPAKDIRHFLSIENYTKFYTNSNGKDSSDDSVKLWLYYVDSCSDDISILSHMRKKDIGIRSALFYDSTALLYEKRHDFTKANLSYLEGLERKVESMETLQSKYEMFEDRMMNRINREIEESVYSSEVINKFIHEELAKSNVNQNNKRMRPFNDGISYNFVIKKKKIEFAENTEGVHSTVKYGQVPVYVDEPFRKNVITKASKYVDVYNALVKFLLNNDEMFKIKNSEFLNKLKEDSRTKPVSWLNGLRTVSDKIFSEEKNEGKNEEVVSLIEKIDTKPIKEEKTIKEVMKSMIEEQNDNLKHNEPLDRPVKVLPDIKPLEREKENLIKIAEKETIINTYSTTDGLNKIRMVKVETQNKKPTEMYFKNNRKEGNKTMEQLRAEKYFEELNKKKDRRKTIIYKVDSDGEICMESDEEKPVNKSKDIVTSKPAFIPNNKQNEMKANHILDKSTKSNLNLFDNSMNLEEINEKIKDVQNMYETGKINLETRDNFFNHLEEKIIQIEKIEESKNSNKINSFSKLKPDNASKVNPFLVNKPKPKENDFISYLEPVDAKPQLKVLLELPSHSILKRPKDDHVSRSLDFTNIKIIESPVRNEARLNLNSLFGNDKSKKDDFSVSFDSDHSHMFNSAIKDPADFTPRKNVLLNIKDTPVLFKKNFKEEINKDMVKINYSKPLTDFASLLTHDTKNKNISDSEDTLSEVERKEHFAKLFGDGFGLKKKDDFPYGLSTITEKNTDYTYLSDDSFIFKKLI